MALVIKDRVKETTTTTGQGTITLAGAVSGFRSFADIGDGNSTYYVILDKVNNTFEVGKGAYTASGTTLSRDTVLQTSAGNTTKISFASGSKDVFVTQPASKALFIGDSTIVDIDGTNNYNVVTTGYGQFTGNLFSAGGLTLTDSGNNPTITFREHSQVDPKSQIVGAEVDTNNGSLIFKTQNAGSMTTALTISEAQVSTFAAKPVMSVGMSLKNGSSSAGFIEFFEDSDNGTNKVTLIGPSATSDITLTLPSSAGIIATTTSASDDATALAIALG